MKRMPTHLFNPSSALQAMIVVLTLLGATRVVLAQSCDPPSYRATRDGFRCSMTKLVKKERQGSTPSFAKCHARLAAVIGNAATHVGDCPAADQLQSALDACLERVQNLIDPGTN